MTPDQQYSSDLQPEATGESLCPADAATHDEIIDQLANIAMPEPLYEALSDLVTGYYEEKPYSPLDGTLIQDILRSKEQVALPAQTPIGDALDSLVVKEFPTLLDLANKYREIIGMKVNWTDEDGFTHKPVTATEIFRQMEERVHRPGAPGFISDNVIIGGEESGIRAVHQYTRAGMVQLKDPVKIADIVVRSVPNLPKDYKITIGDGEYQGTYLVSRDPETGKGVATLVNEGPGAPADDPVDEQGMIEDPAGRLASAFGCEGGEFRRSLVED